MLKKFILLFVLIYLPYSHINAWSDFKKQEELSRQLKKQYRGIKKVSCRTADDGFVYYKLYTKDYNVIIADSLGNVILPQSKSVDEAYESVDYNIGHAQGFGDFRMRRQWYPDSVSAYYNGNKGVFLVRKSIDRYNEYQFYSTDGELLAKYYGVLSEHPSIYLFNYMTLDGKHGLLSMDGKIIIPAEYSSISIYSDGLCLLEKSNDGLQTHGGCFISDIENTKVPCIFKSAEYSRDDSCWKIQIHEFNPILTYDFSKQYNTSYLDEGQLLFEKHNYEDVRRFYTLDADSAKWAQFYIGATYYKEAVGLHEKIKNNLSRIQCSNKNSDRIFVSYIQNDLPTVKTKIENAETSFRNYLEIDSMYSRYVKKMHYELSIILDDISNMELTIPDSVETFERRCTEHEAAVKAEKEQIEFQRWLDNQKRVTEQRERELRWKQTIEMNRITGQSQRSSGSQQQTTGQSQRSSGSQQQTSGQSQRSSGSQQQTSGQSQRSSGSQQQMSGQSQRSSGAQQQTSGQLQRYRRLENKEY